MIHATGDALDYWYNGYYTPPPAVVLSYSILFLRIYLYVFIMVTVNNDYFPK